MNTTKPTTIKQIERKWHLIDAKDQVLGRLATQVAMLLMGKSKPYFVRNLDCGDHVVVKNIALIKTTGNKGENKLYRRHSGYPGGFKEETLTKLKQRKPTEFFKLAVTGMLPKNKLRSRMLRRLHLEEGENHKFISKFK